MVHVRWELSQGTVDARFVQPSIEPCDPTVIVEVVTGFAVSLVRSTGLRGQARKSVELERCSVGTEGLGPVK